MLQRFGFFLLASSALAAVPLASAGAQYYRAAPEPYYRAAPPQGAYEDGRLPAPGYMTDEDDDDVPIVRPPRRPQFSQNPQQVQPGAPTRPRRRSLRSRPRGCRRPRALRWQPSAGVQGLEPRGAIGTRRE